MKILLIISLFFGLLNAQITVTNLGTSIALGSNVADNPDINSTASATSYSNSSWTPPTDGLIIVFVHSRIAGGPTTPTMSGNSLSWIQIGTTLNDGDGAGGLSLFAANASPATTGTTTIDFGADVQVHCTGSFFQVEGIDISGGVSAVFVQNVTNTGTGTSGSISLASPGSADNRPVSFFWHLGDEQSTNQTNWTVIDNMNGSGRTRGLITQYRGDTFETTASASWATSSKWAGIAVELKAQEDIASKLIMVN